MQNKNFWKNMLSKSRTALAELKSEAVENLRWDDPKPKRKSRENKQNPIPTLVNSQTPDQHPCPSPEPNHNPKPETSPSHKPKSGEDFPDTVLITEKSILNAIISEDPANPDFMVIKMGSFKEIPDLEYLEFSVLGVGNLITSSKFITEEAWLQILSSETCISTEQKKELYIGHMIKYGFPPRLQYGIWNY
jgi:hypothetical protein